MIKKLVILLFITFGFSDVQNISSDSLTVKKLNVKIIDIRTIGEWRETGLIPNSIPIMFFNERGGYDVQGFLTQLNQHIKVGEKFAIICRIGSRTKTIAPFLSQQGYNVINLVGGINYYIATGGDVVAY